MRQIVITLFALLLSTTQFANAASNGHWPVEHPYYNLSDKLSLQRGARLFVNYCQGCHSAEFVRYRRLANDLGITDEEGTILVTTVKDNLMFGADGLGDTINTPMTTEDAKKWFAGSNPPDLTLVARKRSPEWIYTYMKSFYVDESRPWGVNNALFPNVAMPHMLAHLQGEQKAIYKTIDDHGVQKEVIDRLEITKPGLLTAEEYDAQMIDLVNFMVYISDPMKLERHNLGVWVVLFVVLFGLLAYCLKRAFWKQIH